MEENMIESEYQSTIIRQEYVGDCWISTVKLPEKAYGYQFETMIKYKDQWIDYQVRADSMEEGLNNHESAKNFAKTYKGFDEYE